MEVNDLKEKFGDHPLVVTIESCASASNLDRLDTFNISAHTLINYMRYRGEIDQAEENSIAALIRKIVDRRVKRLLQ